MSGVEKTGVSCLLVILGACNMEYISESLTPFLYSIMRRGSCVGLQVTPSFKTRVELFSGRFPDTTGTFTDFVYDPARSPFRLLRLPAGRLDLRRSTRLKRLLRVFLHATGGHDYRLALKPLNTPLRFLRYFSIDEAAKEWSFKESRRAEEHLFGVLQQNSFELLLWDDGMGTSCQELVDRVTDDRTVLLLHYGALDRCGHEYGPNSPEVRHLLPKIDEAISEVYHALNDRIRFVAIFGDHNMVEVRQTIDLNHELAKLEAKPGRDYVFFLNSPIARFWFKTRKAEQEITGLLRSLAKFGKVVTGDDLSERRIPCDEKYGQVIFWLRAGLNICPDFYHDDELKGMHLYLDDPLRTPFIVCHNDKRLKLRENARTVDVMPTILDLLDIEPRGIDGRSLVDGTEPR